MLDNPFNHYETTSGNGNPFMGNPFLDQPPKGVIPGKEVVDIGMDLDIPFDEVIVHYPQLTDPSEPSVDPLKSYGSINDVSFEWGRVFNMDFEPVVESSGGDQPSFNQAPPKSAWQAFKGFFQGESSYHFGRPLSRHEKFDRAFDTVIGSPLRVGLKAVKGMTWGAQDLAWAAIKRAVPEDVWADEVKNMTLDEAMDWASGYNPSGFQKSMGEVAEFVGRLKSVEKLTNRLARPMNPSAIQKAGEAAVVFGAAGATQQIQKMVSQTIDPSEAEYGYEGPIAVLRDMALGAIFSFAESGFKTILNRLTPSEYQRALKVLGLKDGATESEISQATRDLARRYHPDKAKGLRVEFEKVMDARETLRAGQEARIIYRGREVVVKGKDPTKAAKAEPSQVALPEPPSEIVRSAQRVANESGEPAFVEFSREVDDFVISPEPSPQGQQVKPQKKTTLEMSKELKRRLKAIQGTKIVDSSNNPLTVYHGTRGKFDVFKPSKEGSAGPGIYFIDSKEGAREFGLNSDGEGTPRIIQAQLNIKNPKIIKDEANVPVDWITKDQQQVFRDQGHDGIIHIFQDGSKEYVAFSADQVVQATGTTEAGSLEATKEAEVLEPWQMTKGQFEQDRPAVEGFRYHGSPDGDIETIDPYYHTQKWKEGIGFYTTDSREAAKAYAEGRTAKGERKKTAKIGGKINYITGEPKKILDMDSPYDKAMWDLIAKDLGYSKFEPLKVVETNQDAYNELILQNNQDEFTAEGAYAVDEILQSMGFDALQHTEGKTYGSPHTVIIWRDENRLPTIVRPEDVHRSVIEKAALEGLPVPRNVLEEYKGEEWADKALAESTRKAFEARDRMLGRTAGQAPIIGDLAQGLVEVGRKAAGNSVDLARNSLQLIKRNVTSARAYAETLGPGGQVVAEDLDDIAFQVTKKTNTDALEVRRAYKGLSREQREMVGKAVNGRIEDVPGFIEDRADILRTALDNAMNEASELGMLRKVGDGKKIPVGGSGKAYPQVPNAEGIRFLEKATNAGKGDPSVFAWAADQVEAGRYTSVDNAVTALQGFNESRLRGMNSYLESFRVELPEEFIEWDGSKVLTRVIERNWMTVEGVRKWGDEFQGLSPVLEQIKIDHGSYPADALKRFVQVSFGRASGASPQMRRLSNAVLGFQFTSKVAVSPLTILRNMTDRLAKGLMDSPMSTLRALAEYPPFLSRFLSHAQNLEEEMLRRGAVFSHGSLSEGFESGNDLAELLKTPFSASERGNQVFIALVRYHKLKADLVKLGAIKPTAWANVTNAVEGVFGSTRQKAIEVRLGHLADKARRGETITKDDVNKFLHEAVQNRAFPMILDTKPIWWDSSPIGRIFSQFKTWSLRQTNMIWEDVLKYTVKTGDPSRLLGFIGGVVLGGELYNIARDALTGREESVTSQLRKTPQEREIGKAILNDLLDGGLVGMLADFTYGVYDWASGVSIRSGKNIWDAVESIYKSRALTPEALNKLASKEFSLYRQITEMVNRADAIRDPRNIAVPYLRARAKAFDFRHLADHPGTLGRVDAWTDAALFGRPKNAVGENSLAYEMIQRSIILGDVEDAAKYVEYIISHSDDLSKAAAGLKQSARNRAPLGPVSGKNLEGFKDSLSAQEWEDVSDLQHQFIDLYSEAVRLGVDRYKDKQ